MISPTRFPNGLTNVDKNTSLGNYGAPDPTKFHTYFNDFNTFTAADWTITAVETGAGSATQSILDQDGGVLRVLNDDADNDYSALQVKGEQFLIEAGKELFFKARFNIASVNTNRMRIGLHVTDSNPFDGVTDSIVFRTNNSNANLSLESSKDSSGLIVSNIATLTDNVDVTVAFKYDGIDTITYFVNDVLGGTFIPGSANLPDDEELTVSVAIQNGAASANSMEIDYIFVAKER